MFVLTILLLIAAVIAWLVARFVVPKEHPYKSEPNPAWKYTFVGAYVLAGLTAICLLFSSLVFVGTRQVGIIITFAEFNPQQQTQGAELPGISALVQQDLQAAVGSDIEIISVKVPGLFYDEGTQQRIDAFNKEAQETKNAEQRVRTAKEEREAAEQRAAQAKPDLTVAIFTCVMEAAKNQKDAAGCWGQIGQTPVITMPKP